MPETLRYPGAFGRAQLCDVNGDLRPDVLSDLGGVPIVVFAPASTQTALGIPSLSATGLTPYPAADRDDILVSAADGLTRLRYETLTATGRPGYVASLVLGSAFADSRSLSVCDLDGAGQLDLAALTFDGQALRRARADAAGNFTPEAPLALPFAASHLAAFQRAGQPVFAIAGGTALALLDAAGQSLDTFQLGAPILDLAVVDGALVALSADAAGSSWLTVFGPTGAAETPLALGPIDAVGLSVADLDGLHGHDLLITGRADGHLRLVRHSGVAGASYLPAGVTALEILDEAQDPSGQRANAVAADFDLDGDVDIFIFHLCEALRGGVFARESAVLHTTFAPELVSGMVEFDGPYPHALIDVSPRALRHGALPTHVMVELWAELPLGASYPGQAVLNFPMGQAIVEVDPLAPDFTVRVDAPVALGDRAWVVLRGLASSGQSVTSGSDRVVRFERAGVEVGGGGTGGADDHRGDAITPPPPPPHFPLRSWPREASAGHAGVRGTRPPARASALVAAPRALSMRSSLKSRRRVRSSLRRAVLSCVDWARRRVRSRCSASAARAQSTRPRSVSSRTRRAAMRTPSRSPASPGCRSVCAAAWSRSSLAAPYRPLSRAREAAAVAVQRASRWPASTARSTRSLRSSRWAAAKSWRRSAWPAARSSSAAKRASAPRIASVALSAASARSNAGAASSAEA